MSGNTANIDVETALERVEQAAAEGRLTESAVQNLRAWLVEERYAGYRDQVLRHVVEEQWRKLDDVFWAVIPFGTGGRRGRMYPIGSNAINDRTIGESAQGLAEYVREQADGARELSCAIAYDTRHNSRRFAELCAGIMVAAGFKVYFLDDYRATPQLSFAVRHKGCDCGIMVTASHNPPSDNAVKVYWKTGGQVLPPHDKAIIDRVMRVQEVQVAPFDQAVEQGRVEICTEEVDAAYLHAATACGLGGPREVRVLYTPLHGVGSAAVLPLLERDGFTDVQVYGPHAEPSGDFPNVPGHVSNPENRAVFEDPIEFARSERFDLVLATDPDADRLGVAAPLSTDTSGEWATLTGNQIGAVMADYVLSRRRDAGTLSPEHYVVKTLVTTELVRRISESYSVRCESNLQVGFKWIAGVMDQEGPERFVFGTEESHGYLVGDHVRDKDGAVACMMLAELAAQLKADGKSLHQRLDELFQQHGYHAEHLINVMMEGSEGMVAMQRLMQAFRSDPPRQLGGLDVAQVRDYRHDVVRRPGGETEPLHGPPGDLVILDLAEPGNYVGVRPSGTEPKVKFYLFTSLPPQDSQDLKRAKKTLADRLSALESDVRAFAAKA